MAQDEERKRDGDERRRVLCDAAIEVLAAHGSRGLTHQQVDRYAGMPNGTTSYYFRTREALLRGVGGRVAAIDTENLRSIMDGATDSKSPFARLAQLVMVQSEGFGLKLNRARLELLLNAARDPALAATSEDFAARVAGMARDAIGKVQLSDDPALLAAQSDAVMTFIAGVFTRFAAGDHSIGDVDQLEGLLLAIAKAAASNAPRTF